MTDAAPPRPDPLRADPLRQRAAEGLHRAGALLGAVLLAALYAVAMVLPLALGAALVVAGGWLVLAGIVALLTAYGPETIALLPVAAFGLAVLAAAMVTARTLPQALAVWVLGGAAVYALGALAQTGPWAQTGMVVAALAGAVGWFVYGQSQQGGNDNAD